MHRLLWEDVVRSALVEDLGRAGDLTTDAIVPDDARARFAIVTRQPGACAGLPVAAGAVQLTDPAVSIELAVADGTFVAADTTLAVVEGPARAVLTAERTALNLLGHLSGIATTTRSLVEAVAGTDAAIADTRKTTPGLRALEKYAVRCGGGTNHRFGLDDAVLIKDNHIAVAGSVTEAVHRARASVGHLVKIEVEVDDLDQLSELLALEVDAVLLDNMSLDELRTAVGLIDGRLITEASGGITVESAGPIAATGVDLISAGWITHSAPALDVGLDAR
jgi:nicotinate-nucleotide pyrophosphorylase (carboxylating)